MTFTKEQLIEKLQHRISVASGFPGSEKAQMDLELARIALASLEAEPVAFRFWPEGDESSGFIVDSIDDPTHKPGEVDVDGQRWLSSPLYTAPPAPVSVPAAMEMDDDFDSAFEHGKAVGWNACRAAMLHGAAGNSPAVADGKTPSMEVLTSQMLFDGHTVLEGEFGFIGYERAYEILRKVHSAWIAEAPQQEVSNGKE